jgi:hypothetical protein
LARDDVFGLRFSSVSFRLPTVGLRSICCLSIATISIALIVHFARFARFHIRKSRCSVACSVLRGRCDHRLCRLVPPALCRGTVVSVSQRSPKRLAVGTLPRRLHLASAIGGAGAEQMPYVRHYSLSRRAALQIASEARNRSHNRDASPSALRWGLNR